MAVEDEREEVLYGCKPKVLINSNSVTSMETSNNFSKKDKEMQLSANTHEESVKSEYKINTSLLNAKVVTSKKSRHVRSVSDTTGLKIHQLSQLPPTSVCDIEFSATHLSGSC